MDPAADVKDHFQSGVFRCKRQPAVSPSFVLKSSASVPSGSSALHWAISDAFCLTC